jgi:hypothetical protein
METWVTNALVLAGTFSCACIILAYRDYALWNRWPIGRWDLSDNSWVKFLAFVLMFGRPLIGLFIGPWWLVFVVPVIGFFVALVATNLLKNLIQPVAIGGLLVGWFFSIGVLGPDPPHDWTANEIQNAQHLLDSHEADGRATELSNVGGPGIVPAEEYEEILRLKHRALDHARQVSDAVLAKAHPELPRHFRDEYERSLELLLDAFTGGAMTDSIEAGMLHDRWVDWWNANNEEVRIPRR